MSFYELGINNEIIRAIEELGFQTPMPVQEKVIPHLFSEDKRDMIGLAQTGTGKTAAFGLPLIQNTITLKKHTQYLILAPTRELCLQIADDLRSFSKYTRGVKIAAVFGGTSIERQISLLRGGAHIVSATPGRLLDLINRKKIDISKIETVVLDEADEMLNMGFRQELESILSETPAEKTTLLFSATMPKEVRKIADRFMKNPVEITIGKQNVGAENVKHICYMVQARERYLALKRIVDYHPNVYGIVFCRTRRETQEVADKLMKDGYNADALHGDLSQAQRDAVMKKFRVKHLKLLVATDVAARGLDVDDLTHIINYNLPDELEIYTHRSGRTGRAGRTGTSILIANLREKNKINQIEKQIDKKFSFPKMPLGREICENQLFHLIDRMEKVIVDDTQIESFLPDIYKKLEWLDREELIKKFVSVEFNRFLDYYKNAPDLNTSSKFKEDRNENRKRRGPSQGFTRFFLSIGKTDELTPPKLIGLINDYTGVRDITIGKIEILKNFSFFEVDYEHAGLVLKSFGKKEYRKRKVVLEIAAGKPIDNARWDKRQSGRMKKGRKSERVFNRRKGKR